jgi:histidyl-tRNA synthetase
MSKPSIPKGTRDFGPNEMAKRNYIFDTIKDCFKKYGFSQIETPAMEMTKTLMGKYGEEGDKLIFRILDSGEYLKGLPISRHMEAWYEFKDKLMLSIESLENSNFNQNSEQFNLKGILLDQVLLQKESLNFLSNISNAWFDSKSLTNSISEKALRYDLTVPFARYVVQHQNEISFPFKRYQIQPVWRADRPQKGRYREFYQCDADMIGSNSLLNEIDLLLLVNEVFGKLNIPITIKLNNRKILSGIAEITGESEKLVDITVAIDKLDKIGEEKVVEELRSKNVSESAIEKIKPLLSFKGNTEEKFKLLEGILASSETGKKGIEELRFIFSSFVTLSAVEASNFEFDITLARGLNYYTGAIIEVKANTPSFTASICGGGRYDDLTGIFGLPNMSGVGISFGADRIYDVMNDLNLFPENNESKTQLLFINFGEKEAAHCLKLLVNVRANGINAELYPDNAKTGKQMNYANDKKIPFVALIGSNEMAEGKITLKNMESGEQNIIAESDLISILKK